MIQALPKSLHQREFEHLYYEVKQETLSDLIIPAVPGEYYAYSSRFTRARPLYALMKCKANKDRPIATAKDLGHEANILFLFDNPNQIRACTVNAAYAFGLLGDSVNSESFGKTLIGPAGITTDNFYELLSQRNAKTLVETCHATHLEQEMPIALKQGAVIAMMTNNGKYGLFFVKEITQESIWIDACHILL